MALGRTLGSAYSVNIYKVYSQVSKYVQRICCGVGQVLGPVMNKTLSPIPESSVIWG